MGCGGEAHRATLPQANAALYGQQNVGVDMDGMLCADCGTPLNPDEVYVCETCDREQKKFINSVMGEDDDG
ncbi:protein NinF [Serratia marcescens]|uniref:protein NinF n=1 Tax=Serratia marcescens TaxID=615 RepID=UPI000E0EBA6B